MRTCAWELHEHAHGALMSMHWKWKPHGHAHGSPMGTLWYFQYFQNIHHNQHCLQLFSCWWYIKGPSQSNSYSTNDVNLVVGEGGIPPTNFIVSDKCIGHRNLDFFYSTPRHNIKCVAKTTWYFEFYKFGLCFLKENDRYPFLLIRMWKFYRSSYYSGFYSSLSYKK